jgi:hypothetical protein
MAGRLSIEKRVERQAGEPFREVMRKAAGRKSLRRLAADFDCDEYALRLACQRNEITLILTPAVTGDES